MARTTEGALERFLRYVKVNTQSSDEHCDQVPSSDAQFDLARMLVEELHAMGVTDASVDEHAYVLAHIPASKGSEDKPGVGFIAHLDTTEVAPGYGVKPHIVHYDGGVLTCGTVDGKPVSMDPIDFPYLSEVEGEDLVVTDGTTLLGGDDKAGVAEIMTLAARLMEHPELPHPMIGICFCPDEEIGHGASLLDIPAFGCKYGFTVDGGAVGELEYECFNAAEATVTFDGYSIHPGDAKGRMVNASDLFFDFHALLPREQRPQYTCDHEGFIHIEGVSSTVTHATARYIIRDHDAKKFDEKIALMQRAADFLNAQLDRDRVHVDIKQQYRNMAEVVGKYPEIIDAVLATYKELDIEPRVLAIRGGTDGAQLSFRGLPCPNLGTGGYCCHSVNEFVVVSQMERSVDVLQGLAKYFA